MTLQLDGVALAIMNRAMTALLSPLDYETPELWRHEVNEELKALLGADIATFLLPSDSGPWVYSAEADPRGAREYPQRTPRLPGNFSIWQRQLRLGVWSRASVYGRYLDEYHRSEYYNEFVVPIRAFDSIGITIPFAGNVEPDQLAGLMFHHDRVAGPNFGERGLDLLRLLKPAFVAGVDTYHRLVRYREDLAGVIDSTGEAILLLDGDGRELHRTPALVDLLSGEGERELLLSEAKLAGVPSCGRPSTALTTAGASATRSVRTARARYHLCASRADGALGGCGAMVVVTIRVEGELPIDSRRLKTRFGLTRRQVEVTLLLTEGKSNEEIARALFISPHTARHHTEQIMSRLGVHSRAKVAARLRTG